MTQIKAIETVYNGYRFRSRLEARWAVFFDTLGIEYRYEPEGFDLDGIWYLPDFFLLKQECWFEVKPDIPTCEEREKAIRLCIASQQPVILFAGDVWKDATGFGFAPFYDTTREEFSQTFADDACKTHWLSTSECITIIDGTGSLWGYDLSRGYMWSDAFWLECANCGSTGILAPNCLPCEDDENLFFKGRHKGRLSEAYISARQARFERNGRGVEV